MKKESKDKVVGTRNEKTYAYSIQIKNLKSSSIDLVVQDQIPITQNAEIVIEALELSKGELDERTGIINWNLTIRGSGEKDIELKYKVKFDKDKNVPL